MAFCCFKMRNGGGGVARGAVSAPLHTLTAPNCGLNTNCDGIERLLSNHVVGQCFHISLDFILFNSVVVQSHLPQEKIDDLRNTSIFIIKLDNFQ